MSFEKIIFYILSAIVLGSAVFVITSRNSVQAVLLLVLAFVGSAGLWILLESEYLALTLIVVYVGAVMVLFLFVVMMLDMNMAPLKEGFTRYMPIGALIATLLVAQLAWVFFDWSQWMTTLENLTPRGADYSSIEVLGKALFTEYLYPIEVAGTLLFASMVAAVSLTLRGAKRRKVQNPSKQIEVRAEDRVKLIEELD
jgi:NADH-quinone oxidoreductase subunit J